MRGLRADGASWVLLASLCATAGACGSNGAMGVGSGGRTGASSGGHGGAVSATGGAGGGGLGTGGKGAGGLGGVGVVGAGGAAGTSTVLGGSNGAVGGAAGTTSAGGSGAAGQAVAAGGAAGARAGVGGAAGVGGTGAGGQGGTGAHVAISPDKLDLLFLIDDSSSMQPLQKKLADQFPSVLGHFTQDPVTGHATDLQVAVVSSSMGGGAWSNVNQCHTRAGDPSSLGDYEGIFLQGPGGLHANSCTQLATGETYLVTGDGHTTTPNFSGDINAAFACMAQVGDKGCGFESQFEAVEYALMRAMQPRGMGVGSDPDNGGFLRPDARLAVVMLTNEDDCSVGPTSLLLDPAVNSNLDPAGLGALQSYRCNEFGHLCDDPAGGTAKVPPPHALTANVTLTGCVSAENDGKTDPAVHDPSNGNPDPTMGHLLTVASFVDFLKSLKGDPRDVFLAAVVGPPEPYVVVPQMNTAAGGEIDPTIQHSCTATSDPSQPEYGDPAVRITQAVSSFGANGITQSICDPDFNAAMVSLATAIHGG
jgi:hypothetical protein